MQHLTTLKGWDIISLDYSEKELNPSNGNTFAVDSEQKTIFVRGFALAIYGERKLLELCQEYINKAEE